MVESLCSIEETHQPTFIQKLKCGLTGQTFFLVNDLIVLLGIKSLKSIDDKYRKVRIVIVALMVKIFISYQ